jgi:uncharacterized OsmC-like protein
VDRHDRAADLRHALWLSALSIVWSGVVGSIAVYVALASASLSLLGFGADAVIDAVASVVLVWRFMRPEAFALTGDEPPVLLGSNQGPNAVELILQALAFCYGVGYVYNAAARGIDIEELRYEIEGDLDLHRFLGLGGPRAGFGAIRAKAWVRSPNASREQLEALCQYVQDTSPVLDILANPVPVTTGLEVLA